MKVIYISEKPYSLTINKEYEVLSVDGSYYRLINDNNICVRYKKDLFIEKINEEPIIVEKEVIKANDFIINIDRDGSSVRLHARRGKIEAEIYLEETWTAGNCGVHALNGLNTLSQTIINLYSNIENEFNVEDDFVEKLISICIKSIIEYYESNPCCAALVFSTNNTYEKDGLWKVMDKFSTLKTDPIENPNSYNMIKTWYIVLELIEEDGEYEDEDYNEDED